MNTRRIEALRAMAQADESPHEQEIARVKLAEAGIPIEPPRPPAPPMTAAPDPNNGRGTIFNVRFTWNFGSYDFGETTSTHYVVWDASTE